jgi:DNA repair exonuclease SbcCD ATPase subunit
MENSSSVATPAAIENKNNKKRGGAFIWFLVILLLAGNGVLAWLYLQEKQRADKTEVIIKQVFIERDNVKSDLLKLQEEYATLQTNDSKVNKELDEKRAYITQLLEEAEKHKGDAYVIMKLKKETETLRKIMKHYVYTIDSLGQLNKSLVEEKKSMSEDLNKEKDKATNLSKEKEDLQKQVDMAALLKATNFKALGIRTKSGGKKEFETTKASKVERIKVSLSFAENPLAKKGPRTAFFRVMTPDGKEMAKSPENTFSFDGSKGFYAGKQPFEYGNQEISITSYCMNSGDKFVPGKYMIEVTVDGSVVGSTTLVLE